MRLVSLFFLAGAAGACGGQSPAFVTHTTAVEQAPLGQEMALVVPAEKNDVLGLVYDDPALLEGHSLDLTGKLRDNPCAEFLTRSDDVVHTRAADAWPVTDPLMTTAGFDGFRPVSTHLFMLLDSRKASFAEPAEGYAACCEQADCGDGLVDAAYEGELILQPALLSVTSSPPLALVHPTGEILGLSLHEGRTFEGVVAVELLQR